VVVEDLHWSDQLSAQALLFALRRMRTDRVLGLVSTRPGELSRLGDGWTRFIEGDRRATRIRVGGLSAEDLATLAQTLGVGDLSGRAVARLVEHTGGNALHSRALLEEVCGYPIELGGPRQEADRSVPVRVHRQISAPRRIYSRCCPGSIRPLS